MLVMQRSLSRETLARNKDIGNKLGIAEINDDILRNIERKADAYDTAILHKVEHEVVLHIAYCRFSPLGKLLRHTLVESLISALLWRTRHNGKESEKSGKNISSHSRKL